MSLVMVRLTKCLKSIQFVVHTRHIVFILGRILSIIYFSVPIKFHYFSLVHDRGLNIRSKFIVRLEKLDIPLYWYRSLFVWMYNSNNMSLSD
jgi:hypothetical protein